MHTPNQIKILQKTKAAMASSGIKKKTFLLIRGAQSWLEKHIRSFLAIISGHLVEQTVHSLGYPRRTLSYAGTWFTVTAVKSKRQPIASAICCLQAPVECSAKIRDFPALLQKQINFQNLSPLRVPQFDVPSKHRATQ